MYQFGSDLMDDNFSNTPMDLEQSPSIGHIPYQSISRHYPKIVLIQTGAVLCVPFFILGLMVVLATIDQEAPINVLLAETSALWLAIYITPVLLFFGLILGINYKEAKTKRYCVREHDLIFHYGLLTKTTVVQPLLRVQHLEVSQNPLEAKWDLATLKLYSAGGFRHTFALPGLTKQQADNIRQYVAQYQEEHHE